MPDLTADRLREILDYDPETGVFRWRVQQGRRVAVGDIAGCVSPRGYVRFQIDGKKYGAGRLAWLYMTSSWPSDMIDHANGIRSDDRFANLREATASQNMANRKVYSKIGFKGVSRNKNKWNSYITVKGKKVYLGTFALPEEASAAYMAAAEIVHGEFARAA